MKDLLLKFAGLFVERVPVEEPTGGRGGGRPASPGAQPPARKPAAPAAATPPRALQGMFSSPSGTVAHPPAKHAASPATQDPAGPGGAAGQPHQPLAAALRAWVPQEYATHLAAWGLHVVAAGGELTPEQARRAGAHVLLVSAECLGTQTGLLEQPQLPTVFITPRPAMIPEVAGVVQVQEPLRASQVANAARDAVTAWSTARRY